MDEMKLSVRRRNENTAVKLANEPLKKSNQKDTYEK